MPHRPHAVHRCGQYCCECRTCVCTRVCLYVCLCVCWHNHKLCKSCWTDRDAVWGTDSCGPRNLGLGVRFPRGKGQFWAEWRRDFPARCRPAFRLVYRWCQNFPTDWHSGSDAACCQITLDTRYFLTNHFLHLFLSKPAHMMPSVLGVVLHQPEKLLVNCQHL